MSYRAEWVKRNPGKQREYNRRWREKSRNRLIDLLGGVCKHCGFSDRRALQFDHVDGGAYQELRGRGVPIERLHREIKAMPWKYQLLCANCNWIKRWDNNENKPRLA